MDQRSKIRHATTCIARFAALAVLTCAVGASAWAQYSGPGVSSNAAENKPEVLTSDPAILRPANHEYTLGPGDSIALHVYGVAELTQNYRILPDGKLSLSLIGTLDLAGLTTPQAEHLITLKLKDRGMVLDPLVTITVVDSPNLAASVIGEVKLPSLVPVLGKRTLIEMLAAAGGLMPTSSHIITVVRPGLPAPITLDLGNDPAKSANADIPIFGGDHIIVPRAGVVYTFGAFKNQTAYPLSNATPLTLLQLSSMAGGIPFEAKRNGTYIIRTVGTDRKEIRVDLDRIVHGKDPDPVLQPDDIVVIPTVAWKAALRAGGISTVLAVIYATEYNP
jgi:polysaccharide export outer membrane protein